MKIHVEALLFGREFLKYDRRTTSQFVQDLMLWTSTVETTKIFLAFYPRQIVYTRVWVYILISISQDVVFHRENWINIITWRVRGISEQVVEREYFSAYCVNISSKICSLPMLRMGMCFMINFMSFRNFPPGNNFHFGL